MNIRQLAAQRPALAAIGCAGVQFLLTLLILKAGIAYARPEMFGKIKLVAFASTIIFPMVLTQVFGLWRKVGLELDKLRPAPFFLVCLVPVVAYASMGFHANEPGGPASILTIQFFNAFGEELLFRGVIFALLLSLPTWQAIAINGILFGSMHLLHGFMDASWPSAMSHAVMTIPAGMMFVAVRHRTGSLWLAVALHMILNLSIIYSNVEPAAGPAVYHIVQRAAMAFELAVTAFVMLGAARRPALA
jgi:membrane protease YdiL (CAAX protease family)